MNSNNVIMMKDNFEKWLNDNLITEVECLVPDLGGIARGKILPTKKFIEGIESNTHRMPQSIFIQTISGGFATEDDEELPIDVYNPTDIDVILRPDFKTIRIQVDPIVGTFRISSICINKIIIWVISKCFIIHYYPPIGICGIFNHKPSWSKSQEYKSTISISITGV